MSLDAPLWRCLLVFASALLLWIPAPLKPQGLPRASPSEIGILPGALPRITAALQRYVDTRRLSGIVAVIARRGKIGYMASVGYMDRETRTPMRSNAVFRIFSLTKPIIAVATLQLVEQGKLRLDDPVSRYVPAFAQISVSDTTDAGTFRARAPSQPATIRHLLTHTAGLAYGAVGRTALDSTFRREGLFRPDKTNAEIAARIAALPLLADPDTKWMYGMGFEVLGAVIEEVTGQPLDVYLNSALFVPLGMRDTGFQLTSRMQGRVPELYDTRLRPVRPFLAAAYRPGARFFSGGGGLLSTPQDYSRFAQMLLNDGTLDGVRILSASSVAQLMRNQLSPALTPISSPIVGHEGYGQGLGGVVLVNPSLSGLPGHEGIYRWWGSLGTFLWIDPKAELMAMVWTQNQVGRDIPLEQDFQRLVYEAIP